MTILWEIRPQHTQIKARYRPPKSPTQFMCTLKSTLRHLLKYQEHTEAVQTSQPKR